jgi:FkbM family methyltransferase
VNKVIGKKPDEILMRNAVLTDLLDRGAEIRADEHELTILFQGTSYTLRKSGSDLIVFSQIIMHDELAPIVEYARRFGNKDIVIMDCGSNIGMSVLFFKNKFPEATVIGIEPKESNFQLLKKNIAKNGLSNILPFNMGVWYEKTVLYPDTGFRDGNDWSFSLKTQGTGPSIAVDTIENTMRMAGQSKIDILKIDIEGAEFKLFEHTAAWESVLQTVKILSVEVHEEFGSMQFIERILSESGFQTRRSGELLLAVRPEYV